MVTNPIYDEQIVAIWQVLVPTGQSSFPNFPSIGNSTAPSPYLPLYEQPHLLTCHHTMFTQTQQHGIFIVMFCHVISQDSKLAIQLQAKIAIFYARRLVPRGKSTFRPRGESTVGFLVYGGESTFECLVSRSESTFGFVPLEKPMLWMFSSIVRLAVNVGMFSMFNVKDKIMAQTADKCSKFRNSCWK